MGETHPPRPHLGLRTPGRLIQRPLVVVDHLTIDEMLAVIVDLHVGARQGLHPYAIRIGPVL